MSLASLLPKPRHAQAQQEPPRQQLGGGSRALVAAGQATNVSVHLQPVTTVEPPAYGDRQSSLNPHNTTQHNT